MNKYLQVLLGAFLGIGSAVIFGNDEALKTFISFTIPFFAISLINNSEHNDGISPFGIALTIYIIGGVAVGVVSIISDVIEYLPFFILIAVIVGLFFLYALLTNKKS
ncbi:hypothetical protein [Pedobacter agri]|uniref:Uncharacterized protein n=1 Tax=Pedobacter agri TaxID=454586 RepID=A0A9X3DG71_9SPHI|nr:hypothetical protein [Pedobacter agri]MCX3267109.1 hypothetical protein [Pedobacter agri]